MSNYEQKEGQGSLFKNDKKTNEKQPDYSGSIMVDGKAHKLAGWVRESKNGKKFLSLKVESTNYNPQTNEQKSDDLPF